MTEKKGTLRRRIILFGVPLLIVATLCWIGWILQQQRPESKRSWHCRALEFQTCDAMCYGRMFLQSKERFAKCHSCHIHDDNFDFLEKFIEEHDNDK